MNGEEHDEHSETKGIGLFESDCSSMSNNWRSVARKIPLSRAFLESMFAQVVLRLTGITGSSLHFSTL